MHVAETGAYSHSYSHLASEQATSCRFTPSVAAERVGHRRRRRFARRASSKRTILRAGAARAQEVAPRDEPSVLHFDICENWGMIGDPTDLSQCDLSPEIPHRERHDVRCAKQVVIAALRSNCRDVESSYVLTRF